MSGNVFGNVFRVVTFGESHGPFVGLVIDGLMPGLPVDTALIQKELDRRRPGQSDVVSPRIEEDRVRIVSGVMDGKTTGTPLCMLVPNRSQRSGDYRDLENVLRPGHAGYTFLKKYGLFDYRGSGRASGRETASRVAAGSVARQLLSRRGIEIVAYTRRIGEIEIESVDLSEIEKNPVRSPDRKAARRMVEAIVSARNAGDSLGGLVEIVVSNCPAGLGEPVFEKLEADLASALMSIGAVRAFEVGSGFGASSVRGSEHNDLFLYDAGERRIRTVTNNAGGILGGISNGEEIVMRIAVKPPSGIGRPQETVDLEGKPVTLEIGGRHDPCICPRIVPVAEAMTALVLIDHILMQERISAGDTLEALREKIDTIDTHLLLLLAARRDIATRIARVKARRKLPVEDRARERDVRGRWKSAADFLNLPSDYILELLDTVITHSKKIQDESIREKPEKGG